MIVKIDDLSSESSLSSSTSSPSTDDILPTKMSKDELRRCVSRLRTEHSDGEDIEFDDPETIDELNKWISKLETALQASEIASHQWSDAAIIFMAGSGKVNMAMRSLRESRNKEGLPEWIWEDFKDDLRKTLGMSRYFSVTTRKSVEE